jgi:hypothetical protein
MRTILSIQISPQISIVVAMPLLLLLLLLLPLPPPRCTTRVTLLLLPAFFPLHLFIFLVNETKLSFHTVAFHPAVFQRFRGSSDFALILADYSSPSIDSQSPDNHAGTL